jgi:uroporphyrinogen-III synthase
MSQKTVGVFNKPSNKQLINDLKLKNYDIFLLPEIQVSSNCDSMIFDPKQFDWLVFTDCYSVDFFVQMLETKNLDKFELDNLRICVFGEAVADKLRLYQIHADVIPPKIDIDTIFQSICNYQTPNKLRFFLTEERSELSSLLKHEQAEIFECVTYKSEIKGEWAKLNVLIKNGAIDEVIFASPNEVNDWNLLISPQDFVLSFNEIMPIATDSQTFQYLFEHGLKPRYLQK